jgi:putative membrane protein
MIGEIRAGRTADGIIAAVERAGAILAEHFPRAEGDINELPDRLIVV